MDFLPRDQNPTLPFCLFDSDDLYAATLGSIAII